MKNHTADNLMFLRKSYPNIYENIRNKQYDPEIVRIARNRGDQIVLQLADEQGRFHFMYSKYDVEVEIERWLQSIEDEVKNAHHILFFGLGLGYHLRAFIHKYPNKKIYIYEPDANILMAAIECVDLRDILKHKQVNVFALGQDDHTLLNFVKAIYDTIKGSITTIILPAYRRIHAEPIKRLQETISRFSLSYQENLRTMAALQLNWAENIILNMEKVMNSYSFAPMKDSLRGIPAVVVGSGPSLDMEIEWLRKLKNKVLIIAAGSSIQGLLYNGIRPDLVVSMDPKPNNLEIFNKISDYSIPFLFIPNIYAAISDKEWELMVHAIFSNDELSKYWLKGLGPDIAPPEFIVSSTVSGTAIQAAIYMGCSEIVMIGQDYSYPEERYYARGVNHRDNEELEGKVSKADMYVENVSGGLNKTSKQMHVLKTDIEAIFQILDYKEAYNASKIGAKINHTKIKTLEDLYYENQHVSYEEGWFHRLLIERLVPYSENNRRMLEKRIVKLKKNVEELKKTAERVKKHLGSAAYIQQERTTKDWLMQFDVLWDRFINHELQNHIYKFFLYFEYNYVSRYWTEIQLEKDLRTKINQIVKYSNMILDSFLRVTEVLEFNLETLTNKLELKG